MNEQVNDQAELTLENIAELEAWDEAFQRPYGPDDADDKPDLVKLRSKIFRRLYQWMPQLLEAAKRALAVDECDDSDEPLCGDCNTPLTLVRPGSHQCDNEACPSKRRDHR